MRNMVLIVAYRAGKTFLALTEGLMTAIINK